MKLSLYGSKVKTCPSLRNWRADISSTKEGYLAALNVWKRDERNGFDNCYDGVWNEKKRGIFKTLNEAKRFVTHFSREKIYWGPK